MQVMPCERSLQSAHPQQLKLQLRHLTRRVEGATAKLLAQV
jgi:hypothetical protein